VWRSGPRSAAGRPAGGGRNRGGKGDGKRMLTCGPRLAEGEGESGGGGTRAEELAGVAHAGEGGEERGVLGLGEELGRGKRGKGVEGRG
jgi:hypothetical protein